MHKTKIKPLDEVEKKIEKPESKGAIFVMPRSSSAWVGAEALWITVAGWAAAAERFFGKAWVVTTDRIAEPDKAIEFPVRPDRAEVDSQEKSFMNWIPMVGKTFAKDVVLWAGRNRRSYLVAPWDNVQIAFVWEQHDLFKGPGRRLASRLKVPLVIYVHAPIIWESQRWGVRRPIWGRMLEYFFETPSLRGADLVACVSREVASKLAEMGVENDRIIVSPMGVDARRFSFASVNQDFRKSMGLTNRIVIGWTGSFRAFHGLQMVIRVFASLVKYKPQALLMLVGDGAERPGLEKLASDLGISQQVLFTGRVAFSEIPNYVSTFDIALASAGKAEDFHYSPLKLREYLAAGKPTLAPNAGEIADAFNDNEHLLLYPAGDPEAMLSKLLQLLDDESLRLRLSEAGRKRIQETGTWDYELRKILAHPRILSTIDRSDKVI